MGKGGLSLSLSLKLQINLTFTDLQMGLKYGCPVEDIVTGLAIQCRGWRSINFNPERNGFQSSGRRYHNRIFNTHIYKQSLIQHKRWSEGDFQIFASRYCPFVIGYKTFPLKLQLSYCYFLLWAANCLPTLYYVVVPSLCLLRGISLFPKVHKFHYPNQTYL